MTFLPVTPELMRLICLYDVEDIGLEVSVRVGSDATGWAEVRRGTGKRADPAPDVSPPVVERGPITAEQVAPGNYRGAGVTEPENATESQANEPLADQPYRLDTQKARAGGSSRPDAGRSASATSEMMDETAGRDRHPSEPAPVEPTPEPEPAPDPLVGLTGHALTMAQRRAAIEKSRKLYPAGGLG